MSFFKFEEDDLFVNTIEAYPLSSFYVQSGTVYINNRPNTPGINDTTNHLGVPEGFISLYEYNIDRPANNYIYPFLIKDGKKTSFRTITGSAYTKLTFESTITSSYRMSASISRDFYNSATRSRINALKNVFDHYAYLSPHYQYSSSFGDKSSQTINLVSIPSVFYGSSIKKGSVRLKFYMSGSLIGELHDQKYNGELVQVGPEGSTGSGSVAGVVLYNEGFVALTGSWQLNPDTIAYDASDASKWIYFNFGANDGNTPTLTSLSSSFLMEYSGTNHVQTMTMFAHAKYGELNHSNNPTFVEGATSRTKATGSVKLYENPKPIKNIVHTPFVDEDPEFKKVTYISKIAIYDDDKNLIGIAKVATPVRKTEQHQYTFKLKIDI